MNERPGFPSIASQKRWKQARDGVLQQRIVCVIRGCSLALLPFDEVKSRLHLLDHLYCGVQDIPLDQIRGSVGRYNDFTSEFLPLKDHMKERWQNVDSFMAARGAPPIEVYQVGEAYFVVDGNHRVSVARQQGMEMIEAKVWQFSTPAGLSGNADMEEVLLKAAYVDFLERTTLADQLDDPQDLALSEVDGYADLMLQIETYRLGLEAVQQARVGHDEAAAAWHQAVYQPAVRAIAESEIMAQFPKRTVGDLYVWAWRNQQALSQVQLE